MKNISIKVIDHKPRLIKKIPYVVSKITIGNFDETFDMAIKWWTIEDYENQWRVGLERLKSHDKSCLVTEAFNLDASPLINWWLIYKKNNKLYIYNHMLFQEYYIEVIGDKEFTPQTCYNFIDPEPLVVFEDGSRAAEWIVPYE